MPQLNPAPWFSILVFSWLILLIIPSKVLKYTFNYNPMAANKKGVQKDSWIWPWY
uniref:ATP synthase complex subunit 8 n=1 Tax=Brycon orbignyanus TaxID=126315 RepID=A0A088Q9B7_9TELE|nr:ATP synthase F0 subunit 8 [Brycon orbignyanus]AIN79130.1 ATP synthase F0 subunit 8 [Brycon orbignyanus]ARS00865.1 ATP synthase F0 subunit 8 [Brycon orbignyanus]